jgi:hypothetical protein
LPNTDISLDYLRELLNEGFNKVKWVYSGSGCDICRSLNNQEWTLEEFIYDLHHEAPIFEHSHVNCNCYIEVSNNEGEIIKVNWNGLI